MSKNEYNQWMVSFLYIEKYKIVVMLILVENECLYGNLFKILGLVLDENFFCKYFSKNADFV